LAANGVVVKIKKPSRIRTAFAVVPPYFRTASAPSKKGYYAPADIAKTVKFIVRAYRLTPTADSLLVKTPKNYCAIIIAL